MFKATVLTLFPAMFPASLGQSLAGEALGRGIWSLETKDIRDHGIGKHRVVDDRPTGGGPGMVLRADVLSEAIDAVCPAKDLRPRLVMSPRGLPFTQCYARELSLGEGAVFICGRFEGIDERVIEARNLIPVSLGDFILSGGEVAAIAMLDSIIRLLPNVMGHEQSGSEESFENNLLEYPQYTKPREFEGLEIPEILLGGNHQKIADWRKEQAERITQKMRPDLWEKYKL
jgi:tRNA (guanine37-N1)-methyltransferase